MIYFYLQIVTYLLGIVIMIRGAQFTDDPLWLKVLMVIFWPLVAIYLVGGLLWFLIGLMD